MEPVTIGVALTVAGKAFEAIKKGFEVGRDIESMGGDLARWMGAASDVDNAERTAKNPSYLQRVFGGSSLEANAIEAVVAKKKMEKQRYEMKTFLNMTYGPNAWNDVLKMEGEIRKRRQREIYDRQKLRRQIIEYIGWFILFCTVVGFLYLLAFLYREHKHG